MSQTPTQEVRVRFVLAAVYRRLDSNGKLGVGLMFVGLPAHSTRTAAQSGLGPKLFSLEWHAAVGVKQKPRDTS
jgi:hypothetical protein